MMFEADRNISGLSPEASRLVDDYFARVHGALLVAATGECAEALQELRSHVLEQIEQGAGTADDVQAVLTALGTPEELARDCSDVSCSNHGEDAVLEPGTRLAGTVLGIPYDLRPPDPDRVASRWWNPLDPHVFVPRIFGFGWTVNFAAVAVATGVIRPDDEDEPFSSVPPVLVTAMSVVPLLVVGVLVAVIVWSWPGLPPMLPSHWDFAGRADDWWARGTVATFLLALAVGPALWGLWIQVRRSAALNRAAASAMASFFAMLSLTVFLQTLHTVNGARGTVPMFVGIVASFALPFLMLVALAVVGRSEDRRRDLRSDRRDGR